MTEKICIDLTKPLDDETNSKWAALNDGSFQIHVRNGKATFYRLRTVNADTRCPVIVNGGRCGEPAGHTGKHCWAGGD